MPKIKLNDQKVVCAMSGGVDSAVSAALLKKEGFEVIGVFAKFWAPEGTPGVCLPQNACCTTESEQRARETAKHLGIPFYVFDMRQAFKMRVVDRFIAQVRYGLTPNPCVICNQDIKFGLLLDKSMALGAEYIATGHYAQVKKTKDGRLHLFKGKDKSKDQSYFLWRLDQKQLARIIFPVGGYNKAQVRQMAKKMGLPPAETPESQEACFAAGDMASFLAKHCGSNPGDIVNQAGQIIGRHEGLWFYTVGQRKGIKLSGGPFYVAKKDIKNNRLIVAGDASLLTQSKTKLGDVRWVAGGVAPAIPCKMKVRIRYRSREIEAELKKDRGLEIEFKKPQFAVTPGQSAVFYKGQEILGGGIISGKR